jgi:hypothetical protein
MTCERLQRATLQVTASELQSEVHELRPLDRADRNGVRCLTVRSAKGGLARMVAAALQ